MQASGLTELEQLATTVVQGGYCIGCGACTAMADSPVRVELNAFGQFEARWPDEVAPAEQQAAVARVCPFSDAAIDEDTLARELFSAEALYHPRIGYHLGTFAGHVAEGDFRSLGSSGGVGRWIGCELLKRGLVDAVVHVQPREPTPDDPLLFRYTVAHEPNEVKRGAKSAYYPVEMSQVLAHLQSQPGRYAITGVPCFIKALRLLARQTPVVGERICYTIGLVCGHLKSTAYADMLAWQGGVPPGQLTSIDFRGKLPGTRANQKGVCIRGQDGQTPIARTGIVQEFFGTNYGQGLFKYKACDYCDDVLAETADIVVGDAWLPQYVEDGRGTSVVVVRHPELLAIVEEAMAAGRLDLHHLSADEVARSQDAGLRHRREGLAYRLALADRKGIWRPRKRVRAQRNHLDRRYRRIQDLRIALAEGSHKLFLAAKQRGSYADFCAGLADLIEQYSRLYSAPAPPSLGQRLRALVPPPLKRALKRILLPSPACGRGVGGEGVPASGKASSNPTDTTGSGICHGAFHAPYLGASGRTRLILIRQGQFINKGAEAMVRTVQHELERRLGPTRFVLAEEMSQSNTQPLLEAAGLEILHERWSHSKKLRRLLEHAARHPLRAPHDTLHRNWLNIQANLEQVDAIIDVAGYAYGDPWGPSRARMAAEYLACAHELGKPYIFMPQAWGPFTQAGDRPLYRSLCGQAALLFARDVTSRGHLAELWETEPERIALSPDIAFRFRPDPPEASDPILESLGLGRHDCPLVAVVPNLRVYERTLGVGVENQYVQLLVEVCRLVRRMGAAVLLVPHEVQPTDHGTCDDRLLASVVATAVSDPLVRAMTGRYTAEQIKSVFGRCELLVGSRFHAMVAALSCGIPVVALGWSHKYGELLTDFGLAQYAVGHDQFAGADLEATVAHVFACRGELREQIRSHLPAVWAAVDKTFDQAAAVIAGGAGLGLPRKS